MNKEHKFSIGRSRENDLVYDHESVSRCHAELWFTADRKLFLIDCHSTNGTFLMQDDKPQKISQELVSPTDTVQLGTLQVSLKELVEAIHLKFPFAEGEVADPGRAQDSRSEWPWGKDLVRCEHCGTPKVRSRPCPVCQRS